MDDAAGGRDDGAARHEPAGPPPRPIWRCLLSSWFMAAAGRLIARAARVIGELREPREPCNFPARTTHLPPQRSPDMTITRKQFLHASAGGTVLLLLKACGGSDDGDGSPPPAQACGATGAAIAGNHGHALSIARADLDSTTSKTYDITAAANHPHSVTFTPAQLQALKAGQSVTVTSTTDALHDHAVTASCA
jgi:hypothetical protein